MNQGANLIVGLGNPGIKYSDTWHNIGANVVEILAARWSIKLKPGKSKYIFAEAQYLGQKCYLLVPTAYMNRSGESIASFIRYFNIQPDNLIVIYDDHDLPLGKIRLREVGTSGGHRGIEDIILRLNTIDFKRLKIGIEVNREKRDLSQQVLAKVPKVYRKDVDIVLEHSADAVERAISDDFTIVMNYYNGLNLLI